MIRLDRRGLVPAASLIATLAASALWAGVDFYTHRHDFPRPPRGS